MTVAYINLSNSHYGSMDVLKERQSHVMLFKEKLAAKVPLYYLLRNSEDFSGTCGALSVAARKRSVPAFLLFTVRFLLRHKIDVVIVHGLHNFPLLPVLKLVPGIRIFMQHHGEKTYLHKKAVLMRFADRFVNGYFFNGKGVAAKFALRKCLSMTKVYEVAEGTSAFTAGSGPHESIKQLIFIGRLDGNKDLGTLLRALVLLKDRRFRLKIYYSEEGLLRTHTHFCDSNGLSDKVSFAGRVSHGEIKDALRNSDVFVSCSLDEAGGFSLIEALACGVFPVVTAIPAFDFLLHGLEHKKQFDPGDHRQLADLLLEVLDSDTRGAVRQAICMHFARRASPEAISETLFSALKTVVQGH